MLEIIKHVGVILFFVSLILLIVYKLRKHSYKKVIITTVIIMISGIIIFIAASIANPMLNTTNISDSGIQLQQEPANYVSVADVTQAFADELLWNTDYKLNQLLELEDKNPDIVTRSYSLEKDGYDSINFDYKYNRSSKQLYNMSMFIISENVAQIEDFEKFLNILAKSIDSAETFELKNIPIDIIDQSKIIYKDFDKYNMFYTIKDNHYSVMFTIK